MEMGNNGVIIDVREPKEFSEKSIGGAINLPLSKFSVEQYLPYQEHTINLICHSGNRAKQVQQKLLQANFNHVIVMDFHMENFMQQTKTSKTWTVDRQFRMLLGLLLATFLIGYYFGLKYLIAIPIILSTGLIFTSLIDRCYLRMGIAMLPWNRQERKENS